MTEQENNFDRISFIINYECGEVSDEDIIEGFQHMIDDGTVWQLQGSYGRMARALIDGGYCTDVWRRK